jgi:hypothetical protein
VSQADGGAERQTVDHEVIGADTRITVTRCLCAERVREKTDVRVTGRDVVVLVLVGARAVIDRHQAFRADHEASSGAESRPHLRADGRGYE